MLISGDLESAGAEGEEIRRQQSVRRRQSVRRHLEPARTWSPASRKSSTPPLLCASGLCSSSALRLKSSGICSSGLCSSSSFLWPLHLLFFPQGLLILSYCRLGCTTSPRRAPYSPRHLKGVGRHASRGLPTQLPARQSATKAHSFPQVPRILGGELNESSGTEPHRTLSLARCAPVYLDTPSTWAQGMVCLSFLGSLSVVPSGGAHVAVATVKREE